MVFEHQKTLSVACCTGPYLWGSSGPRVAPGAGADAPSHVGLDGADDATGDVGSDGPGAGAGSVISPAGELKSGLVLSLK